MPGVRRFAGGKGGARVNRSVFGAGVSRLRGVGFLLATGGLLAMPTAYAATGTARLSGHAHAVSAPVPGARIDDVAHLSGGYRPTGTITFALYGPFSSPAKVVCNGPDLYTGPPVPVSGDGDYASAGVTSPAPGLTSGSPLQRGREQQPGLPEPAVIRARPSPSPRATATGESAGPERAAPQPLLGTGRTPRLQRQRPLLSQPGRPPSVVTRRSPNPGPTRRETDVPNP